MAVRSRAAELARHRPAGRALVAVEGNRAVPVLVETLAALEAGWSAVVTNGAWWPRERDALYERLGPTHVLRTGSAPESDGPLPLTVRRDDTGPTPPGADGEPLLWVGSAGGEIGRAHV